MSTKLSTVLVLGDPQPGAPWLEPPFGVLELERHGFVVVNPRRRASGLLKRVRDVIEHRTNMLVEDTVRGVGVRADWVLALLDNNANLVLLLKKWGLPPYRARRLAVLVCWATERLQRMAPHERQNQVERLNSADVLFVLSSNQIPPSGELRCRTRQDALHPAGRGDVVFQPGACPMGGALRGGGDRPRRGTRLSDYVRSARRH